MYRKFFNLWVLLLVGLSLSAQPISEKKALEIAQGFFGKHSLRSSKGDFSISYAPEYKATNPSQLRAQNDLPEHLYYVINRGEGDGYIVVAGDERVTPVLAFGDEGKLEAFDIENHPSIKYLFDEYAAQLRWAVNETATQGGGLRVLDDAVRYPSRLGITERIRPLLRYHNDRRTQRKMPISFGQDWPFNKYAPNVTYTDDSGRKRTVPTVAGCVATCISTVMRWHEWPLAPKGKVSYLWKNKYTMSLDFDKTDGGSYNWSAMPAAVNASGRNRSTNARCTAEEATLIGRLLRDVAYAVKMNYGPASTGGSGAYVYNAPRPLKENFGYKNSVRFIERDDYSLAKWMDEVVGELRDYGPIVYAGFSSGGGHCFAIDGYATDITYSEATYSRSPNDYVHVDWGWNGSENGWYKLEILKPGSEGIGGGSGGYKRGQQMLRYLIPDRTDSPDSSPEPEPTPQAFDLHFARINPTTTIALDEKYPSYSVAVKNSGTAAFSGSLALCLLPEGKDTAIAVATTSSYIAASGSKGVSFSNLDLSKLKVGSHKVYLAYKAQREFVAINEVGGTIEIVKSRTQPTPVVKTPLLKISRASSTVEVVPGDEPKVTIGMTNEGGAFNGAVALYARPASTHSSYRDIELVRGTVEIAAGQTVNLNFYPATEKITAGNYYFVVKYTRGASEKYVLDDRGVVANAGRLVVGRKSEPTPKKINLSFVRTQLYQDNLSLPAYRPTVLYRNGQATFQARVYFKPDASFVGKVRLKVVASPRHTSAVTPRGGFAKEETFSITKVLSAGTTAYATAEFSTEGFFNSIYYIVAEYSTDGTSWTRMSSYSSFDINYRDYSFFGTEEKEDKTILNDDPREYLFTAPKDVELSSPRSAVEIGKEERLLEIEESTTKVYPTTTEGALQVRADKAQKVRLFDLSGKFAGEYTLQEGISQLDLSHLTRGTYLLQVDGKAYKVVLK